MDLGSRKRSRASTEKGRNLRKRTKRSFKEPDSQDSEEAVWWSVQTVLDERKRPGKPTEYKVLWEPNPRTGETYPPSWEPAQHLTADLLAEWKQKNRQLPKEAADGHVEPRSQAAYQPVGDDSLNTTTGTESSTTTPNRSGLRRLDLTTPKRDFSASPAPPSTASSSPRRAPPNQSKQVDPESLPLSDASENGGCEINLEATNRSINNFKGLIIENNSSFPRDEYQGGLSQQPASSQPWPDNSLSRNKRATPERSISAPQPFRQPTDAKTPKVIPDSQSQGILGIGGNSPFDGSVAREQIRSSFEDITRTGKPKSSGPVLETDPVEPTSPASEAHSSWVRSVTGSPVNRQPRTPRRTASPTQPQSVAGIPVNSETSLIGRGSLRSASKTPSRSLAAGTDSTRPSPLRVTSIASPDNKQAPASHQEVFQAWTDTSQHPSIASQDFATLPQSTHQWQEKSSSIPEPPSHEPETLASRPPDRPESFTMAGTRSSRRSAPSSQNANSSSHSSRGGRGGRKPNAAPKGVTSNPQTDEELKDINASDRDSELDEKIDTGVNSSSPSVADGEIQSQALSDDNHSLEPIMDHDAEGHSRLAARMPGEPDDEPIHTADVTSRPEIRLDAAADADASDTESEGDEDQGPPLGQMEFIVPLPFAGQARDQYRKTIKFNEELIEKFTGRKWKEPGSLVEDAQAFIKTMRDITTHIDLTNETAMTQSEIEPSDVVEWDRSVSTKFKLLYSLLIALKEAAINVIIIARPGQAQDILENFLKGMAVSYQRLGKTYNDEMTTSQKPLKVIMLSSEILDESPEAASTITSLPASRIVLAFDPISDDLKRALQPVRQDAMQPERLAPLIFLAVTQSIDHIDHSIVPIYKGIPRQRIMVNCLAKLRKEAGRDDIGLPSTDEIADEIAQFVLMTRAEDEWPLPTIGMLNNNDAWDLCQGLVSMKSNVSSDSEKSAKAKAAVKKNNKRPIDRLRDEEGVEASKKMRMTPQPDPQPENDISETRISDTTSAQSAETQKHLTEELIVMQELLKATEEQLKISKESSAHRIDALEVDLGDVQFRFEEQTAEKRKLAAELSEVKTSLEVANRQRESRDATIDKLKDDIRELKAQLAESRGQLEGSQIPEVAAMEKLRQEKEAAEAAQKRAERNAATLESTMGYIREQMEEARERATELQNQHTEIQARFTTVERQATGEITKARSLFLDERAKNESMENLRLKQEVRNLQQLLSRKEDELRTRRSGMGTRAGSVPRSPRVGPASRAGSPIPDRRIGALKNNMMQGRRQSKPKQKEQQDDSSDGSKIVSTSTPVLAEPKPRSGRPIEMKALEAKHMESKGIDGKDPDRLPVPRPDVRTAANSSRPFPCVFAQYNCGSAFTSKNEWKRHISTKHIQLGFWRCDMCPPSPGIDHPVYNDFNRKDLFTQHLRRMHAMAAPASLQENASQTQNTEGQAAAVAAASQGTPPNLTEEQITEIQKRCYRQLRAPPELSSCVFCTRQFQGPNSWEERLEHVGGHLERDRKNGTTCLDVSSWRSDPPLRDYLVTEGLVEVDPRGGYRIGDGKPKRPLDIEGFAGQAPTAQLTPRAHVTQDPLATSPIGRDGMDIDDSESSTSKQRRRGRPPKRSSDAMEIDIPPSTASASQSQPASQSLHSPREPQHFRRSPPGSLPGPQPPPIMHHPQHAPGPSMPPSPGLQLQYAPGQSGPPVMQSFGPPPGALSHPPYGPQPHGPPPSQPPYQGPPPHQGPMQHQGPPQHPLQSPRDNVPPGAPGPLGYNGQPGGPPASPRQYQLPPANLQNMYKFEHGSFTKFAGTNQPQQAWPALQRPGPEFGHPGLQTRGPGQPHLAPKPPPDPVQEIMSRIYASAPQLAPKPLVDIAAAANAMNIDARAQMSPRPPSQGGPPQQFHSGFRPINETPPRSAGGPNPLAPKPLPHAPGQLQDGGRQLAPKPPQAQYQPPPFGREPSQAQLLPQQHHGPPPPQHRGPPPQQPQLSEPTTPGGHPPQHILQQGPGPQIAPAPSPTAPPTNGPPTLEHSRSHSQSLPQSQPQSHQGSPPRPTTPKQAGAGADIDGQGSARGRSFRDIIMS